jgi:hypothetical protein
MYPRKVTAFSVAGLFLVLLVSSVPANPTDQKPEEPLALHNLAGSQPLRDAAVKALQSVSTKMQGIASKGGNAPPKLLRALHLELRYLRRTVLDLEMHGETAGADLFLRTMLLEESFRQTLEQFKNTQAGAAEADKCRAVLHSPKTQDYRNRAQQRLRQLAHEQKWLVGYDETVAVLDELSSYTTFLRQHEELAVLTPFADAQFLIHTGRSRLVSEEIRKALFQAAMPLLPDTSRLLTELKTAAAGLQTQAAVNVGGTTLHGPQCLEHFGGQWKTNHLSAIRLRAVEWARLTQVPEVAGMYMPSEPKRIRDEDYAPFCDEVVRNLAGLIEADAQRAAPEEVPALYGAYLRILAPLVARAAGTKLEDAARGGLLKLAAKSPSFAQEVQAYHDATDELLRWRERAAAAEARAKSAGATGTADMLFQATSCREGYRGLVQPQDAKRLAAAQLIGSCPEILTGAAKQVVDHIVLVRNVAGLSNGKAGVSHYGDRHYAIIDLPALADQTAALKRELLVTEQLPALSLRATVAIHSAAQGDLVSAGGRVKSMMLEGVIPWFATLRESALPMVPLGPLPSEVGDTAMLRSLLVRLSVTPAWVQHRYFFAALESSAPPAETR